MITHTVKQLKQTMAIDARWDKPPRQTVDAVEIGHVLGKKPEFTPATKARMLYDEDHVYVIFRVEDRYVRAVAKGTQGPVW